MANIKRAIELITGEKQSLGQLQHVRAIAHELDIPENDAMFPILVALDAYHGVFSKLPEKNNQAATNAAQAAADQSPEVVNYSVASAVENLIPTVADAIEKAAVRVIRGIQLGTSMITLSLGLIVLAVTFFLGWIFGAKILASIQIGKLTWLEFWHLTGWGIGVGLSAAALILWSALTGDRDSRPSAIEWGALGLAFIQIIALTASGIGFFH